MARWESFSERVARAAAAGRSAKATAAFDRTVAEMALSTARTIHRSRKADARRLLSDLDALTKWMASEGIPKTTPEDGAATAAAARRASAAAIRSGGGAHTKRLFVVAAVAIALRFHRRALCSGKGSRTFRNVTAEALAAAQNYWGTTDAA